MSLVNEKEERNKLKNIICNVEDCNRGEYCQGFCNKHYIKYKKYGDPLISKKEQHGLTGAPEHKAW